MSDARLRLLERAAATGDPQALERYKAELRRTDGILRHVPHNPGRDPRRDPMPGDVVSKVLLAGTKTRLVTARLTEGWSWRTRHDQDTQVCNGLVLPPAVWDLEPMRLAPRILAWVELDWEPAMGEQIRYRDEDGQVDVQPRWGKRSNCNVKSWQRWARGAVVHTKGDGMEVLTLERCRAGEHCLDGDWCEHYEPSVEWNPTVTCCLCGLELARAAGGGE